MSTLTKLALGMMGRLRPKPAQGDASKAIALPAPQKEGGMPLMEAISKRRSDREFASTELTLPTLSNLLWAAYDVNRPEGAERILEGFDGVLQVDGYGGYHRLARPERGGGTPLRLAWCWSHGRREIIAATPRRSSRVSRRSMRSRRRSEAKTRRSGRRFV